MKRSNKTNKIINRIILGIIVLTIGHFSRAAEYKLFYVDKSGKQLSEMTAMINAVKGDDIYKCQSVEANVSKSGTSVSMRNVKKPKIENKK